uniref:Uncharacterized protein n=1 Tax=Mustela putorius furo TaxID=9669 RepID=M3XNI4_MUSPF
FCQSSKIFLNRERKRESGRAAGRERSRLPVQHGARRGTQSQESRIMTQAESRCPTAKPPRGAWLKPLLSADVMIP